MAADFDAFYGRHRRQALALARSLVPSTELAEDVVQDGFLALWQRWETVDEPAAYLYTSIRNRCRSEHRRAHVHRRGIARLLGDRQASVASPDYLGDVMVRLPRSQQQAVVLRVVGGWTIDQTAAALGLAPGTVKSTTHRGLAKLRAALDDAA